MAACADETSKGGAIQKFRKRNEKKSEFLGRKSAEYLAMVRDDHDVFETICMEAKFGEDSVEAYVCKLYDEHYVNVLFHILLFLFIVSEFIPFGIGRIVIDGLFISCFTADTLMQCWISYHVC